MPQSAPDWVSFDADQPQGLDLLGLRAPVQAIGNQLFNGVTTVTPKLRYMSVITWIIWRYAQARLPDAWTPFARFASAQEAAVVMANLLHDRSTVRLVGATEARDLLDSGEKTLPLPQLVQNIAFNIYVSSSRQLNLTHLMSSGFNGLSEDRGLRLARAFDDIISDTSYGSRLAKRPALDKAPRKDLEELSGSIWLDRIPPNERAILIDALMPTNPVDRLERYRLETYALLLWLSQEKGSTTEESDVFAAALELPRGLPGGLRAILDGWLRYVIRDALAVTHEAVFGAVMQQVDVKSAARGAPALAPDVVASLLGAIDEHNDVLRQFDLLRKNESVAGMAFDQLRQRVEGKCRDQEVISNGLRRWRSGLSETELYDAASHSGASAAALLPVVWCLVAHRISPAMQETLSANRDILSIGGIYQIGLAEVVLPKIQQFSREGRSVLDVMGELITRTVQQHLRIAWNRFGSPQGKDVSVLIADMDAWSRNNGFEAGRTDSRLEVAIDWLRQLGLINDRGLTSAGQRTLNRCLNAIGRGSA